MLRTLILLINFTVCSAQVPDLLVQRSHVNRINTVAISPDNRIFATGSIDKSIRIWELSSGKLLKVINFIDSPNIVEFSPDGKYLYAGGYGIKSDELKVYDTKTWEVLGTPFTGGITGIAFSPNQTFMGIATSRGYIAIWQDDGETFRNYYKFDDASVTVSPFSFSSNDSLIVAGAGGFSKSYPLNIWSLGKEEVLYKTILDQSVQAAQFINNNNQLLVETGSWSGSNDILVLDWKTNQVKAKFKGNSPVLFDEGKRMIFCNSDKMLEIRNVDDITRKKKVLEWRDKETAAAIAVCKSNKYAIAVSNDIVVYDLESDKVLYRIPRDYWTESMSFSPTGNQFSLSTPKGPIINWNLENGTIQNLKGHNSDVLDMFYNIQGTLLSSVGRDSTFIIWDATNNEIKYKYKFKDNDFYSTSINPSGEWVAVALNDTVYSFYSGTGHLETKFSFSYTDDSNDTVNIAIEELVYSPNNRDFAGITSGFCFVYDIFDNKYRMQLGLNSGSFESVVFNADGSLVAASGYNDTLFIYDLGGQKYKAKIAYENNVYPLRLAFSPSQDVLAIGLSSGQVQLYDVAKGKEIALFDGHANLINNLSFRNDGRILASSSWDGNLILWDVEKRDKLCTLYAFEDETWAVIDPQGRYDASNGGKNDHLHFVLNAEEVISLNQLKERYYEPGLVQKLLGLSQEPLRDVTKLKSVALYPKVSLSLKNDKLNVLLQEREGGIGPTALYINDKEVDGNINPEQKLDIDIDLNSYSKFFRSNDHNSIAVVTKNEQGYLQSEKMTIDYFYKTTVKNTQTGFQFNTIKPKMYGIVIGTSDYRGTALDLQFADKDAHSMASAIHAAGQALLGEGNVQLNVLTTDAENLKPDKNSVAKLFEDLSTQVNAEDILVLYLSGHGVNYGGQDGQFYYLTHAVESGDISDEVIRENYTISTGELTDWINKVPARKQVLIIDACASGKAIEDIQVQKKAVSSSQVRAIERLKDRTGMFVIAGSAADKVSFEASQYGQSLLTYSLLSGMKGRALRENEFVDVLQLFQYALDEVPNLAKNIGGVQKPVMSIPYGGNSFDIGRITEDVDIQLEQIKPVFIRTNFQEEFAFDDILNLSAKVDLKFKDIAVAAKSGGLIFVDVAKYPLAYSIKGRYQLNGEEVVLDARVFKDKDVIESFSVNGNKERLDVLITEIIEQATKVVKSQE